jgi:lipopolysaccharide/colanic/teichoic acid biosynthesis glycosyltransferase
MSKLTGSAWVSASGKTGAEPGRQAAKLNRSGISVAVRQAAPVAGQTFSVLGEESFHRMIALERKRTERSGKPFLLMLLDAGNCRPADRNGRVLGKILSALSFSTRETDVTGWYKNQSIVGVLFTEISAGDRESILGTMMSRVSETLRSNVSLDKFGHIGISMHVFPEEWNQDSSQGNPTLYPDLVNRHRAQKCSRMAKRLMDIVGSATAVLLLSPIFLMVAVLVKLSSKGPIFFQQERLGQFGKPFTFLKFRSMYVNNDRRIHQEFMKRVIKGDHDGRAEGGSKGVYKMTNDPRITKMGWILRRTSLDELPQFINVLRGEMSLVGPRPPIAYECQEYDIWHRRRVLEVKPGITGLWQVRGRSRVRFDDMVRLDLQYVRTWSLWLDLQILAQTPGALFSNDAF